MPNHALADGDGSFHDGEASLSQASPSQDSHTSAYEPDDDESDEHQWNSFEMRTLFCLIIKGEHQDRKGPIKPLDFATRLNTALNPGKATSKTAAALYNRDIPVRDVSAMLSRVLAKKRHAVDVALRSPAGAVTRRVLRAFARQLDFCGSLEEWHTTERPAHVARERVELRRREEKRLDGRRVSRDSEEENRARYEDIQSPRARKLLEDWSIGRSFFEESTWKTMNGTTAQTKTTGALSPPRGRSATRRSLIHHDDDALSASSTTSDARGAESEKRLKSGTTLSRDSDNGKSKGRDITGCGSGFDTPAWGTSRSSGETPNIAAAATPQHPATGWAGGFGEPSAPTPLALGGYGVDYGSGLGAAGPSCSSVAQNPVTGIISAYNSGHGAVSPSVQSGAPTYGKGYGEISATTSVRTGAPSSAYGNSSGVPSFSVPPGVPTSSAAMPAYCNGYGGMGASSSVRSGVPTSAYGNGFGAPGASARSGAPIPGYGNGYGTAVSAAGAATTSAGVLAQPAEHSTSYVAASPLVLPQARTPAFGNGFEDTSHLGECKLLMPTDAAHAGVMGPPTQRPDAPMGATSPLAQYNSSMPTDAAYADAMGPPSQRTLPAWSTDGSNNAYGGSGATSPLVRSDAALAPSYGMQGLCSYAHGGRERDEFDDGRDHGERMPSPTTSAQTVDVHKKAGRRKAQGDEGDRQ